MKRILFVLLITIIGIVSCTNSTSTGVVARPGIMAEEKATVELRIPSEIQTFKSGDAVISVYEYDPRLADKAADKVFTKTENFTHEKGKPTVKKFEVQALRKEGFEYYVVIEIFEKTSRYTAKAYSIYDGLGKIYDSNIPNQVFTINVK